MQSVQREICRNTLGKSQQLKNPWADSLSIAHKNVASGNNDGFGMHNPTQRNNGAAQRGFGFSWAL